MFVHRRFFVWRLYDPHDADPLVLDFYFLRRGRGRRHRNTKAERKNAWEFDHYSKTEVAKLGCLAVLDIGDPDMEDVLTSGPERQATDEILNDDLTFACLQQFFGKHHRRTGE